MVQDWMSCRWCGRLWGGRSSLVHLYLLDLSMIIMVCDGSGLDQLSLVWQAVGRAVIRWTELAELKEGGQSSFQCVIQFLRLVNALD